MNKHVYVVGLFRPITQSTMQVMVSACSPDEAIEKAASNMPDWCVYGWMRP